MDSSDLQTIEKDLMFIFEQNRLATFKSWIFPDNHKCNASKMAEAGFIFVGTEEEPDCVKCFLCGKTLDGWREDDDPWKEHLSHSPNCSFAKLQSAEECHTCVQFLKITHELIKVLIRRSCDLKQERGIKLIETVERLLKEMKKK